MKREYWEVIAVILEALAFFLAASDLLGEDRLRTIATVLDRVLRPVGLTAATLAQGIRGIVTIGWETPWPRWAQIAIVLAADLCLLLPLWIGWQWPDLLKGTIAYNPLATAIILFLLNVTVACYLIEMMVAGMTGQANARGTLFIMGAIGFIVSKTITVLLAMHWIGAQAAPH